MKIQKIKTKSGISYRVQLYKKIGSKVHRLSASFSDKALAVAWYNRKLAELERIQVHGELGDDLIKNVIIRYQEQYGTNYSRSKNYDLLRLTRYPIAELTVNELTPKELIRHCKERNRTVKPQTVTHDIIWLKTALRTMASYEGFDFDFTIFDKAKDVLKKERLIGKSETRTIRPTREELFMLSRFFSNNRSKIPMLHIMWFAIYSTRRAEEITKLRWADNNIERKTGLVRDIKNPGGKGTNLRFKYTDSAWKIVCKQPKVSEFIFPYNCRTIGTYFALACKTLGIEKLRFHDLRHEGVSRLFESGLGIERVQLYTLHQDWTTLKRYTHLRPEDL